MIKTISMSLVTASLVLSANAFAGGKPVGITPDMMSVEVINDHTLFTIKFEKSE